MTTCPLAEWDPLGKQTEPRMEAHDIVCLHTMAGRFSIVDAMFHANGYGGTESHFGVRADGFCKQWQDLDFQADANNEGNHRVISIETEDTGFPFPAWSRSDVPAWTPQQLDKLVALVRWLCDRYDIPKKLIPDTRPGRRGIAYHRQGIPGNFPPPYTGLVPGGELWTVLPGGRGKPCPGDRRITQLINTVIPRVQEDDMEPVDIAKGVELAVQTPNPKPGSGVARDDFKTLIIGAVGHGLHDPGESKEPGEGDLREPFKTLLREVLDEAGLTSPSVPPTG